MTTETTISELLTEHDLAAELQMRPQSLADWRHRGKGPAYVKLGQLVRYRRSDVESWLNSQTRPEPTDERDET